EHHEGAEGMPAGRARLLRIGDGASQIPPIGLGRMTLGHERSCLSFLPVHSASPLFACPLVLLRPPYAGRSISIDLQKMNWKFRTGFHEHTGVSLTEYMPNNPIGGDTREHEDTAQSRHRQRAAQPSAGRLSAR